MIAILRGGLGADHSETLRTIESLANLFDAWGNPETAAKWRAKLATE